MKNVCRTIGLPLLGLAGAAFLVALSGCSGDGKVTVPTEAERAGHARMLARLGELADQSDEDNPYLGVRRARELRAELDKVPAGVRDLRNWYFNRLLGAHELMLGNSEQAIRHYEVAYRELALFPEDIPADKQLETIFELGVAHLRDGETRNCVQRHGPESCILPLRGQAIHVDPSASREAMVYFRQVLELSPPRSYFWIKSVWLLNLAYMTVGEYPAGVPEAYRIPEQAFASDESIPHFVNVAPEIGLDSFDLAGGAVADDFDGDGDLDLVVTTSDTRGPMRYYRNDGTAGFTERTSAAGLDGLVGGLNLIHADYDNDGDLDLLVLRGAWWGMFGRHPNSLLRNEGDGTFTDVTFQAGLAEVDYPTQTAAWADFDNDGDLDLYVGNETGDELRAPCQLFRNEGDGTFVDVAAAAGVENLRFAKAVIWGDHDGDRDPDLYVSNIGDRNRFYRNEGDGTFVDVAAELGLERPISSFPAWFWDADNDGALDLFVTAYGGVRLPPDVAFVAASYLGIDSSAERARLFRGDGIGGFTDVSADWNLERVTLPMGSNFGDLDSDGWLDIYLGTGYPYYEGLMPNVMYRNRAGAGFADVTTSGGFGHLQKGHGVVFADLDDDGDADVFEQLGGFYPGDAFGNALFENPGFGHHWLKVKLIGTISNRAAIGARIKVVIREGTETRSIYRHVGSGGTFGGNPLRQEIGLGAADAIESVEIYWPTSDTTQRFDKVEMDRVVTITEGQDDLESRRSRPFPLRG